MSDIDPGRSWLEDNLEEALEKIKQLQALLDAARICFKNRDQSEREAAVYAKICRILEEKSTND
jgi:hypothetical protein